MKKDLLLGAAFLALTAFVAHAQTPMLYGTMQAQGANSQGTIFSVTEGFTGIVTTLPLSLPEGAIKTSLVKAPNGKLYTTCNNGGANGMGGILQVAPDLSSYSLVASFSSTTGKTSEGDLFLAADGNLYGMTEQYGANNYGTIFKYVPGTGSITVLHDFSSVTDGGAPTGSFVEAAGKLYGMCYTGGTNGTGTIFTYDYGVNSFNVFYNCSATGSNPFTSLVVGQDGNLYGTFRNSGANSYGTLVKVTIPGNTVSIPYSFGGVANDPKSPQGKLVQVGPTYLYGMTPYGGANNYGCIYKYDVNTTAVTVEYSFTNGTIDGGQPSGSLILGQNGKLYGIANAGGSLGYGTVFEFDPNTTAFTNRGDLGPSAGAGPGSISLLEYMPFNISAGVLSNVTCNGACDGSANVLPSGGTAPYTINWTPSGGTATTSSGLCQGTYTVTVTETGGVMRTQTVNITQPTALSYSLASQSNVSCNGGSDGMRNIIGLNGTGPYTYSWAPSGGTSGFANNLSAGIYTCTITDVNGCSIAPTFTVTEPSAIIATITLQTNVSCNGGSDGSVTLNVSGGSSPYVYNWTPFGGVTPTASSLTAGSYTCTVTDATGCSIQQNVIITEPAPLTVTSSQTDVTCYPLTDGTATAIPSGGTPPYTYDWPSVGTTATVTGLYANGFTCNVTDANGCTGSTSVMINMPGPIVSGGSVGGVSCYGAMDGYANIGSGPSGGTPPFTYNWTPYGGTGLSATNLSGGTYTCTMTDQNGCVGTFTANVIEYPALTISLSSQTDVSCFGGADGDGTVTMSGGAGGAHAYWFPVGVNAPYANNLSAGSYTVTAFDNHSCQAQVVVTINQPPPVTVTPSVADVNCNGNANGSISLSASGGTGALTYSWTPGGTTSSGLTGLSGGTYTCDVTDANGCVSSNAYTVNEPAALSANINVLSQAGCAGYAGGSAQIVVTGGVAPYFYTWTDGGLTDTETGLVANTYTCDYTDNNSCPGSASVTITEVSSTDLYGALTYSTSIAGGWAYAFKQQSTLNGIDTVAVVAINPGSPANYLFSGLQADNYFIKVILDTAAHPDAVPTYYGNTFQWDSSMVVMHGCAQTDTADINVIGLLPPGGGTGFVSGHILEGPGYQGLRVFHNGGHHNNTPFIPGGPLKGIDVKLGKNPGSGIQARMMTDSTGYFEFSNIPDGSYRIYVDIPNLPMDSLREVTIDPGNQVSVQNNYFADSLMVYVDTVAFVGIYSSAKAYDNKFSIFPNPAADMLNLQFSTNESADVSFNITDAVGRQVYSVSKQTYAKGDHALVLHARDLQLKAGVYFVSILSENRRCTQRIVIVE